MTMSVSEFVNVAKTVKLFRSARGRKTVGRQTVIAITQEKTYGRGMSLDVNRRKTGRKRED